ncbi:MAG: TolC family protein [Chlorobi bacterium]|nr:TolC family protein [Chlorobiota bacterium]
MKKNIIQLLFLNSLMLIIFTAENSAQATSGKIRMTLKECIHYAQDKSPDAVKAESLNRSKILNYEAFVAGYYPQITLSGNAPEFERAINPITQNDGSINFLEQNHLNASGNLSLTQRIPFTGGRISLSSGISRMQMYGDNDILFWRSTPIQLSLTQPLFKFNSMKWDLEVESIKNDNLPREYAESMEELSINVTQKFFNLYIAEMNVKNSEFNTSINDSLYLIAKGRYKVGKIAENDLLQSELGYLNQKNSLEYAKLTYQQAKEDLLILLGIEHQDIEIVPPLNIPNIKVDPFEAVNQAKENTSNLLYYELEELNADRQLNIAENNNSFNADITASFGMNKTTGDLPELYKEMLDQERFGLRFEIPLFQWNIGKARVEAAMANKKMTEIDVDIKRRNFEKNIKFQTLNFLQFQQQVRLSAKSDTIAQRRFEVAKNRYIIGKIDQTKYFIAQQEKDSAFRSYINTLKNYWVSYYRLRRNTLYDFEYGMKINY